MEAENMDNLPPETGGIDVSERIEELAVSKGIDHLQAAIELAKELDWDPSWMAPYINPALKQKLQLVGEEMGILKKSSDPAFRFE